MGVAREELILWMRLGNSNVIPIFSNIGLTAPLDGGVPGFYLTSSLRSVEAVN